MAKHSSDVATIRRCGTPQHAMEWSVSETHGAIVAFCASGCATQNWTLTIAFSTVRNPAPEKGDPSLVDYMAAVWWY